MPADDVTTGKRDVAGGDGAPAGPVADRSVLAERAPALLMVAIFLLLLVLAGVVTKFPRFAAEVPPATRLLGSDVSRLDTFAQFERVDFPPDTGSMVSPLLTTPGRRPWVIQTDFSPASDDGIVFDWRSERDFVRLAPVPGTGVWRLIAVVDGRESALQHELASTSYGVEIVVVRTDRVVKVDIGGARMRLVRPVPEGSSKVGMMWHDGKRLVTHFDVRW